MIPGILKKEFLQLSRNKVLLFMIFVNPLIILGVIPLALENNTQITVGIVDHDSSTLSRHYATLLTHSPDYIKVVAYAGIDLAEEGIRTGQVDIVVVIPAHYERQLAHDDAGPLKFFSDGTHPQKSQNDVFRSVRLLLDDGEQVIRVHRLFNLTESQLFYYLVSLLVLVQTIIGSCLMALNIVAEKEAGVLQQFNSTSLNRFVYIMGKYIYMTLVCLAVAVISLVFCRITYGLTVAGSVWHYLTMAILFSFPLLSLGYLIAVISRNQVQAVYLLIFTLLTMILMSTMFSHLSSMPLWAQLTRFINPVYFMVDTSRLIILKGLEIHTMLSQIVLMTLTGVMLSGTAVVLMIRSTEKW